MTNTLTPGDTWPSHYRGYRLHTNADGDVWWQVYQGSDRLFLDPTPDDLIADLHSQKRLGGRIRITEGNDVITRTEMDDGYEDIFIGSLSLTGDLVPADAPEYSVPVRPRNLSTGDVWPSVYDGAKYSFGGDRFWWQHPQTHKRHPVETAIPSEIRTTLQRLKPQGGSFLVTPWNDVITLVEDPPNQERAREQLHDLPRVIKNIIVLRRGRGVEMLPIYVGTLSQTPLEVSKPRSLTDALGAEERAQLNEWAGSLGTTTETDPHDHRIGDATSDVMADDDPDSW